MISKDGPGQTVPDLDKPWREHDGWTNEVCTLGFYNSNFLLHRIAIIKYKPQESGKLLSLNFQYQMLSFTKSVGKNPNLFLLRLVKNIQNGFSLFTLMVFNSLLQYNVGLHHSFEL